MPATLRNLCWKGHGMENGNGAQTEDITRVEGVLRKGGAGSQHKIRPTAAQWGFRLCDQIFQFFFLKSTNLKFFMCNVAIFESLLKTSGLLFN